MKLYQVHYHYDFGSSAGFSWHGSRREAEAFARRAIEEDKEEYDGQRPADLVSEWTLRAATKLAILDFLNRHAKHPDNG